MPAVGVLDEPRAVEPVPRCAAPDVRGAQGVKRGAHAVRRAPGDRGWRLGRREGGSGTRAAHPASRLPLPEADADPDRPAQPRPGIRGAPEAPGPAVFDAVACLGAEREARERPPFEPAADAPLGGELLRRGIRGEAQRDAGEGVRPERAAAAERLQLVAQPVEGAAAAQRIVEEQLRPEAVRERPAPAGAGTEFVAVGAVTVVPAAAVELPVATLGGEHRRNAEREREPPELSRLPQPPCTPATAGAPCDATGGAEAGASSAPTSRGPRTRAAPRPAPPPRAS